jgi:hypothetical protein
MDSGVTYRCLEKRTGFHTTYTSGRLKVMWGSNVGFSVQRHLPPNSLGSQSDKWHIACPCSYTWMAESPWYYNVVTECILILELLWCISINKIQPLVKKRLQKSTELQSVHNKTKYYHNLSTNFTVSWRCSMAVWTEQPSMARKRWQSTVGQMNTHMKSQASDW